VDARFIIGIDLGTTNCALADVDTSAGDEASPAVQGIAQLINPGEVAAPTLLPSFLFLPGPADFAAGAIALPWEGEADAVIGELARKRGALAPQALALAEQLAPLIALRIRYDCINFALKDSRSYAAALEEQLATEQPDAAAPPPGRARW